MGDAKRWSVTYTKHIKQKRKVYQDGKLELCRSSGTEKATLFDESGKVLESRFLKKDEGVESGGTLVFDSYLIDIGDPEGRDTKPLADLNVQRTNVERICRVGMFGGNKARVVDSSNTDTRKPSMGTDGVLENPRSLVPKYIRGKQKAGGQNTKVSLDCPAAMRTNAREWHALYTTQITQKAKKYHDGTLCLESCGSQRKQVTLYHASRKILDKKFLKEDEAVHSGGTLVFDAYLVDVGDPKARDKSVLNSNSQEKCGNLESTSGDGGGQQKHQNKMQNRTREWHTLYTMQKAQKSKKYHDGILQLAVSVSGRNQVTLLNEDRTILGSKYLNSSEVVKTGNTLEITNYLVDIGETCSFQGEVEQSYPSSWKGKTSKGASLGKISGPYSLSSNIDERNANGNSKLIRNAQQILFTLRRPAAAQIAIPNEKSLSEEIFSSTSSELIRFGLREELSAGGPLQPKSKVVLVNDHKDSENSEVGSITTVTDSSNEISHSKAVDDLGTSDIKGSSRWKPKGPEPNVSPCFDASDIYSGETDAASPKETTNASISSIANSQVSDIAKMNQLDETQIPSTCVAVGLNDKFHTAGASENNSYATEEYSNQLCAGMDDDSKGGERFTLAFSILSDSTSCSDGTKSKSLEINCDMHKEKANLGEFPSFDLGF